MTKADKPALRRVATAGGRAIPRRTFAAGALALAAAPLAARAQATRTYRLAIAASGLPVSQLTLGGNENFLALLEELRRLGYDEGRNLVVTRSSTAGLSEAGYVVF